MKLIDSAFFCPQSPQQIGLDGKLDRANLAERFLP